MRDCVGHLNPKYLATAADDVCHGLAGRILQAGYEGKLGTLGENL